MTMIASENFLDYIEAVENSRTNLSNVPDHF